MEKGKFKITKSELLKIIKEEYTSMNRVEEINARLKAINEELEAPETIEEVEAGGTKKIKSTGWTGAGEGDVKYDEKFEKIGSHLKEDEEFEGSMELGGEDLGSEDLDSEEVENVMGYFEMKFAELGKELDAKMGGDSDVDADDMGADDMDIEAPEFEDVDSENEEEVEEINEDLEEPIEGKTLAQDSTARFNDDMEKDTHVHEGITGSGSGILSEGFNAKQKSALSNELDRMARLAKLK